MDIRTKILIKLFGKKYISYDPGIYNGDKGCEVTMYKYKGRFYITKIIYK